MLVKVFAAATLGIEAQIITVEVKVGGNVAAAGLLYNLVGLPDSAVKEGFHRIDSAIQSLSFRMLRKKITINLAPADIRKEGSLYDLPIALGILAATEQIKFERNQEYLCIGELSLDGQLRPLKGALPIASSAQKAGFKYLILPAQNAKEASVIPGIHCIGVQSLEDTLEVLKLGEDIGGRLLPSSSNFFEEESSKILLDISDIKGQENTKRAMEIAAAGAHNIILIGPPGVGKTMIAKRLPTILPPFSLEESIDTTKIHSVAGQLPQGSGLLLQRPFRSPHHTISDVAMVGGGSKPRPGEISLAHHGVLFLDELPEFKRSVLETMRQPLEDRQVTISRAKFTVTYPSSFMLVASMNPSPSGYFNDPDSPGATSAAAMQRYLSKISGPLLDRMDIHIEVTPVPFDKLSDKRKGESSVEIRKRVSQAREIQKVRFQKLDNIHYNAQMNTRQIREFCQLDPTSLSLLKSAMERLNLSARAYDRILKVSRTIADLAKADTIDSSHISEAILYRSLDREGWLG